MVLAFFDFTFQPGGRAGRKVLQIKLSLGLRRRRGIFGELLQIVPNGRMESRGRKVRGKRLTGGRASSWKVLWFRQRSLGLSCSYRTSPRVSSKKCPDGICILETACWLQCGKRLEWKQRCQALKLCRTSREVRGMWQWRWGKVGRFEKQ